MRPVLTLIVQPRDLLAVAARTALDRAVASSAVDVVQLRLADPQATATDLAVAAAALRVLLDANAARRPALVVNAPLALVAGAAALDVDGWHVKERELSGDLAALVRADLQWGASVHSVDAAQRAARAGANYLQVGTMFLTKSHPGKTQIEGPQLLQKIRADGGCGRVPLVAVGGISTRTQIAEVVHAGADGVAVIRAVLEAADPFEAAIAVRRATQEALVLTARQPRG
ncbi:hypothetical protein BBJ28_00001591 [Nothophytophthora sp. Chile5]|nr:hypothetical protein BBJ28_00001591 [Nothophytophthora sp. Chile5]